jgi:hypothetical protein
MKIRVLAIDFETPRWLRRVAAYVVPFVLVAGAVSAVVAAPQQWKANDPLTATDLNKLAVVAGPGGVRSSVGATKFCGPSSTSTNGSFSYTTASGTVAGYVAAKAMCEAAAACGSSPTAHMCSGEEILRSVQIGVPVSTGWYSSTVLASVSTDTLLDCDGWGPTSVSAAGALGSSWGAPPTFPTSMYPQGLPIRTACMTVQPILCCD